MSGWQCGVLVVRTLTLVIVRRMLGVVGSGSSPDANAVAVLRHQLAVLRQQMPRPRYNTDRARCWPAWPSSYPGSGGRRSWSRRRPCCGGIASWWPAVGPTSTPARSAEAWTIPWSSWWCSLRGRTRVGDTCGSWTSAAPSDGGVGIVGPADAARRHALDRHPGVAARPGPNSSPPRLASCSPPVTSSQSRPSPRLACTYCS